MTTIPALGTPLASLGHRAIHVVRGEAFAAELVRFQEDDGSASDVSGWSLSFEAVPSLSDGDPILSLTEESGLVVTPATASVTLSLTSEQTAELPASCAYRFHATRAAGSAGEASWTVFVGLLHATRPA